MRYIMATLAFSFFIICPRMAAMTDIISKNLDVPIYWIVLFGSILSIPFFLIMCWTVQKWGLVGGLVFAVITDLLSAIILGPVSIKSSIETIVIAIFVIAGNRIATWITARIF